ncbi:hypothetical protein BDV95DRAFT_354459 [Massariosphaeria phaeospora]|uniref:Uncharacterized protein n=1 Tax=Massariosphaeria phaeospora TaxID=100035 RepID=A0A7C8I985_9PLEO|nr:hypothetical protein BDV95DRAFT_354459 [Massariosphaeria phaeospora]
MFRLRSRRSMGEFHRTATATPSNCACQPHNHIVVCCQVDDPSFLQSTRELNTCPSTNRLIQICTVLQCQFRLPRLNTYSTDLTLLHYQPQNHLVETRGEWLVQYFQAQESRASMRLLSHNFCKERGDTVACSGIFKRVSGHRNETGPSKHVSMSRTTVMTEPITCFGFKTMLGQGA